MKAGRALGGARRSTTSSRSTASRLARMVFAALGVTTASAGLSIGAGDEGAAVDKAEAHEPADTNDFVEIHEDLLSWKIKGLEPNSGGSFHIHKGTSCDVLGSSLWDTEATNSNPWKSVRWSSDDSGTSWDHIYLDEIAGAYSFPANLGHAVAFYSDEEKVVACQVIESRQKYRDYGVQGVLNRGLAKEVYQSMDPVGELILRKNNVLKWGIYNLEVNRTGQVSVLAGRNCNFPERIMFKGIWDSNERGISKGEMTLDNGKYIFAEFVGRAVAIHDAKGKMMACNTLSHFVKKTSVAIGKIEARLKTISDIVCLGQATAVMKPMPDLAGQCVEQASKARDAAYRIRSASKYLAENKAAYKAIKNKLSASWFQRDLMKTYKIKRNNKKDDETLLKLLRRSHMEFCVASTDCENLGVRFSTDKYTYEDNRKKLTKKKSAFNRAVKAVDSGNATPEQEATAAEYHTLIRAIQSFEDTINQRIDAMDTVCLPDMICAFNSLHGRCSTHEEYNAARLYAAKLAMYVVKADIKLSKLQYHYQAALNAKRQSSKQKNLIATVGRSEYARSRIALAASRSLGRIQDNDASATGTVTLVGNNELSWQLDRLPAKKSGRLIIHEATSCTKALGSQAAFPGKAPYKSVSWVTSRPKKKDMTLTSTKGLVKLSKKKGTLSFKDYHSRAVVVYSPEGEPISCGVLTLQ
mmetsp:Transcript_19129/g.33998  ORF Transcript_19129/g.33998 Transcript_19129/m.33998 type:complete len:695 (-) Transcript_19129:142-2226(-)